MIKKLKILAIAGILIIINCCAITHTANAQSLTGNKAATVNKTTNKSQKVVRVFHSPSCPHCRRLLAFIESDLMDKYPGVKFEINNVQESKNYEPWKEAKQKAGVSEKQWGVPQVFIGDKYFIGFGESTKQELINAIK